MAPRGEPIREFKSKTLEEKRDTVKSRIQLSLKKQKEEFEKTLKDYTNQKLDLEFEELLDDLLRK